MNEFYKRGFHKESRKGQTLLKSISPKGDLKPLIDLAEKDKDLTIQIRNNYFNIYYIGGNVGKVNSPQSIEIDLNYFRTHVNNTSVNFYR